ncbi:MAG: glycerol-3-phosphate dehydrogenase/oxidase [Blastocatellia bacterium]
MINENSWRTRNSNLERLRHEQFDVLIIGGGITGAGLARDAAVRGLKTALVEKRDFSAGTSSRSTKLIHGGLRYLEHFDFALVREGLRERALLTRLAPHLAEPFPFLIPIYQQKNRNYDHPWKVRAGLILYDLLAGKYSLGRHDRLSRDEALAEAPQLDPRGLKGAYVYYDCRTDDSRLVVDVLKTACAHGAVAANYTRLTGFIRDGQGRLSGACLRDEQTGAEFTVRARVTINATGVWMEDTVRLNGSTGNILSKNVRPSKGVHLTVPAERLRVDSAWLIPALTGHRFYFVVPWGHRVNVGTTDTDYEGDREAPRAEADEVREILGAVNSYFPEARLDTSDVISSWAGLRPLISDHAAKSTAQVSRKEEMIETPDGLISIAGGKLTTYRLMAEEGIDLAARRLREHAGVEAGGQRTDEVIIGGGDFMRDEIDMLAGRLAATEKLPPETARHLLASYGLEAVYVAKIAHEDERFRAPLTPGLPHIAAEIIYAVRYEMAVTVSDALTRRTRLAMVAGEAALACAEQVAELMAREMAWDKAEVSRQVAAFIAEFYAEYAIPETIRDRAPAGR